MFAATGRWFKRNRTPIAIGMGVVGAGYVVTNYVLGKLRDARERMSSDRIAKENLRRRFEQNQEDCTFTILALLPTATTNIIEALDTEKITYEIQQMKGSATARTRSIGSTSPPSMSETNATDDDGRSIITVSAQSEGGMHTTQISVATPSSTAVSEGGAADTPQTLMVPPMVPPKPRKTKRQLWDELTISSITRAYTLLYTLSLLTMLTRIQLNLLGRRSYLSSVVSLATGGNGTPGTISLENNDDDSSDQAYGTDFDVNRRYLAFSWWLLNRGCVDVMQRVEGAVRKVYGHLSPRDTVTLDTFAKLSHDVRRLIEGSAPTKGAGTAWLPYLFPPLSLEAFVLQESGVLVPPEAGNPPRGQPNLTPVPPASPSSAASLRRLLDETADLIESPHFAHVHTQLLDAGFAALLEHKLVEGVFDSATLGADPLGGAGTVVSRAVLLPKILSVLTRQAHAIGRGMPNEYLQAMEAVPDLEGFAAVVYSSNWQAEIVPEDDRAAGVGIGVGVDAGAADSASSVSTKVAGSPPPPPPPGPKALPLEKKEAGGEAGEASLVIVDKTGEEGKTDLFDSAWEKASASK
ncbi:Peroxin-3 [Chaetomium tenue]|uniref:Peroxin-3 n=1 Tax=Chaetomium tenue TaxID=1854479 RepID=A0ACB7PAR5_9PEZI|nr:Peroxin-3 [Chaetomium globosum]